MSDDDLRVLMAQKQFPWASLLRGEDDRAVPVVNFLRFAKAAGFVIDEDELDRFVERLGGKRTSTVDPWSAPSRWLRALARRPVLTNDIYLVPRRSLPTSNQVDDISG